VPGLSVEGRVVSEWRIDPGGRAPDGFSVEQIAREHGQPAIQLRWKGPSNPAPGQFVALGQIVEAREFRGKRIRFGAAARAEFGSGALVLRIDGPDRSTLFFDNMADRPIVGKTWSAYSIEANVPPQAERIYLGLLASGRTDASFSDVSLTSVGEATPTSDQARAYLVEALDLLQRHHIRSASVDWERLRADALSIAEGAQTARETYGAIRYAISRLGERHTAFIAPASATAGGARPERRWPTAEINGRIGSVRLTPLSMVGPGGPEAARLYAETLGAEVRRLDAADVCGWVIDLRGDSGGNMWPMLNGLKSLLGDPPFGAFVTPQGAVSSWVEISGVVAEARDVPRSPPTAPKSHKSRAPIALLIGPQTASSGEMVAIALQGRPQTRSFGSQTAGLVTANQSFVLSDGAVLAIATAWVRDRTGRTYTGALQPDQSTASPETEAAARSWLSSFPCH
jgi:C-terminal processing protease CtpA/Prc